MNKKAAIIFISSLVSLTIVGFIASPLLYLGRLSAALKAKDPDLLEVLVDFPAVRESVKSQISAKAAGDLAVGQPDDPLAALGTMLGMGIANRAVDSLVTPDGLAFLLRTGRLSDPAQSVSGPRAEMPSPPDVVHFRYVTLNRFKAELRAKSGVAEPLGVVLERRGLFTWKLVKVALPLAPAGDRTSAPDTSTQTSGATTSATAAEAPPSIPSDEPPSMPDIDGSYWHARSQLLNLGYRPTNSSTDVMRVCAKEIESGELIDCPADTSLPEVETCSGTGAGYCIAYWLSPTGHVLKIQTAGEPQPGAIVSKSWATLGEIGDLPKNWRP